PDRLSCRDGEALRRGGAVVRELARMIGERSARYSATSYTATVATAVAQYVDGLRSMRACPAHALTHEPAHHASPRGHVLGGDMNVDCVGLLPLRIDGVPRPMPSAGRLDLENKAITHPFPGDAVSDPCVARANLSAAGCDMDPGLAIGARPIAEVRGPVSKRDAARADRQ